ncbi:Heme-binding-like protein At3g10130, chloroplastic [Linum perenne]
MGLALGKIKVETPKYEVIKSCNDYMIRKYGPAVAAQITYKPSEFKGDKDGGFSVLAKYIGVFGNPQNAKPEKIAMTAPVITKTTESEKIAMTVPVVTKVSKVEEAPSPVDERVVIREVGERKYGVVTFSGVASDDVVEKKLERLKESLVRDGYKIVGEHLLARYNPPWITLPSFRTNEVMIPVE